MCFQNTEFRPGRNCLFTTAQKHVKIFVAANKKKFLSSKCAKRKVFTFENTQPIWSCKDIFLTRAGNVKEFVRITKRRKKLISENVGRSRHNCYIIMDHGTFITEFYRDSFDKDDDKKVFNANVKPFTVYDNFNRTLKIREMEFYLVRTSILHYFPMSTQIITNS